jgi:hypothetical protein
MSLLQPRYELTVNLHRDDPPGTLQQKLRERAPARPYFYYNVVLPQADGIGNCREGVAIVEKVLTKALEDRGKAPLAGQRSATQNEQRQIIGTRSAARVLTEHVEHLDQNFVGMPPAILTHYVKHSLLAEAFSCRIHDVDDTVGEEHQKILSLPPRLGIRAWRFVRHPERRAVRFEPMRRP